MMGHTALATVPGRKTIQLIASQDWGRDLLLRAGRTLDGGQELEEIKSVIEDGSWQVKGYYNNLVKEAGAWIKANIPAGSHLLCDPLEGRAVYFFTDGEYPVYLIRFVRYVEFQEEKVKYWAGNRLQDPEGGIDDERLEGQKTLFLWPFLYMKGQDDLPFPFRALREGDVLRQIREKQIDYVVIASLEWNFFSLYFEANPSFRKIAEMGDGVVKIFKVERLEPLLEFETRVCGASGSAHLKNLRERRPKVFESFRADYLQAVLGMSDDEIEKLIEGRYPIAKFFKVY